MTPQQQAGRAARLYASGRTLREIAEALGIGDSKTVWRAIVGRVDTRRVGPRGRTDITNDQVVELRDELGLSWTAMAAELGMSRTGVRARYLRATGQDRWR